MDANRNRSLLIQFLTSSIFLLLSVSFAHAAAITLNLTSGYVGDTVKINGTAFGANEQGIVVIFNSTTVTLTGVDGTPTNANGTVNASASGAWNATFVVPAQVRGVHVLNASGNTTTGGVTTTFTINPRITTFSPTSGYVGDTTLITGTGFANESLTAQLDG
ncbi:MAG: hypothetical protein AB1468_04885, partial [Candidatus Micrarchaeota archaeon]